LQGKPY